MSQVLGAGTRFGPYDIDGLVGRGGMGEVYRARDTRLKRIVALKVLPVSFATDADRRARFEREAQVLASLNHPNIAAIYGIEQAQGAPALVMEFVDGPTLADRIAQGALHLDDALSVSRQIAEALAAAHERGVIHRDLKPANIKLRADSAVKVLDFGLAKARESIPAGASGVDSPTHTVPAVVTEAGVVLGTPAYMSPEQARGETVDERTDIWAFGVMLYEMLAGRRPFDGRTTNDTLAAVLREEPDLGRVPQRVRPLLRSCLKKDPRQRLRHIGDAWLLLEQHQEANTGASFAGRWRWPAAAIAASAVALALFAIRPRDEPPPAPQLTFEVAVMPGHEASIPVVSPDGRHIAYVAVATDEAARAQLWLHSLETGRARPIHQSQKILVGPPAWSPDGRFLLVGSDGMLMRIDVATGAARSLTATPSFLGGFTWNEQDVILFSDGVLRRVSAQGGTPETVTQLDGSRKEIGHYLPVFLPDGRHFLYLRVSPTTDNSGIYVGSLDAKPSEQDLTRVVASRAGPLYVPADGRPGRLLFVRGTSLMSQSFDPDSLQVVGDAIPVVERVDSANVPTNRFPFASVSRAGVLAYRTRERAEGVPVWVDRQGRELELLFDDPIAHPISPRLSPDGRRLAVTGDGDVWIHDLTGRPPMRLTTDGAADTLLWSPDGRAIVYETLSPPVGLLLLPADGSAAAPRAVSPEGHYHGVGWSADGRELIAAVNTYTQTGWDVVAINSGRKDVSRPVVQSQFQEGVGGATVSPDGRWIAYTSNATGSPEVWVQSLVGRAAPVRISPDGGGDPLWSRDGREIFYLQDRTLMAIAVSTGTTFEFAKAVRLFDSVYLHRRAVVPSYDMAADGRFLMIKPTTPQPVSAPFTVVLNWRAEAAR